MYDCKSLHPHSPCTNAAGSSNANVGNRIVRGRCGRPVIAFARYKRFLANAPPVALLAITLPFIQAQEAKPRPAEPATKSPQNRSKSEPKPALGHRSTGSRFTLAFKTSSLGLGADLGVRLMPPLNVRCGFGMFHYTEDLLQDGVPYHGTLHLRSLQAMVDWFPLLNSFHVSSGLLFYNGNRVTAIARPPVGQIQHAGDIVYVTDPQNPLTGRAQSGPRSFAPMIAVGFGNLVPRTRHWAYSVDFGVVYQGRPKSDFSLQGGTCDPTGVFCSKIDPADSNIQAAARTAVQDLDRSVTFMRFYPAVTVEFGYRF